jgi:hypothetical protein
VTVALIVPETRSELRQLKCTALPSDAIVPEPLPLVAQPVA